MKISELIRKLQDEFSPNPNDAIRVDYFDMIFDGHQWQYINNPVKLHNLSMPIICTRRWKDTDKDSRN